MRYKWTVLLYCVHHSLPTSHLPPSAAQIGLVMEQNRNNCLVNELANASLLGAFELMAYLIPIKSISTKTITSLSKISIPT